MVNLKQIAAIHALEFVKNGMKVGLGSGSTARYFIQALGERWISGGISDLLCVSTSTETTNLAREFGLPLVSLSELIIQGNNPTLDLAVDGADEVDPQLDLIKGLGKAALREKIVEMHARRFVVIIDESKLVTRLGRGPLPVEIIPLEADVTVQWIKSLGCRAELWHDEIGTPVKTECDHWLVRCWFPEGIRNPKKLAEILERRIGIVDHGLFLGMTTDVVVASEKGVKVIKRKLRSKGS
jgi:ribose 5-phosphate isomerase A